MHFLFRYLLFFTLLFSSVFAHKCQFDNTPYSTFDYVNYWRVNAGLHELKPNELLKKAALNHSRYRTRYNTGHHERKGDRGFTGRNPSDRAAFAGYALRHASENIAESPNAVMGVENLMTAIYHRFGFLDYRIDEMGRGQAAKKGKNSIYTYVMGQSFLARECSKPARSLKGSFYRNVCKNSKKTIAVSRKYQLEKDLIKYAPKFVLYPFEGATKVPPAFYEEHPDPLPRYTMVGNPLSIEFHPRYKKSRIEIKNSSLRDMSNSRKIPLMSLYKGNDPHKKLSSTQFALFPKQRLEWGRHYEARFSYKIADQDFFRDVLWHFKTSNKRNIIEVRSKKALSIQSHKTYTLYFRPNAKATRSKKSVFPRFGFRFPKHRSMKYDIVDSMTIQVCLHGKKGDRFKVKNYSTSHNTEVELILK